MAQYLIEGPSIQLLLDIFRQFFLVMKGLDFLMHILFLFKKDDEVLLCSQIATNLHK